MALELPIKSDDYHLGELEASPNVSLEGPAPMSKRVRKKNRRPLIEPLEPRLLFSASADIVLLDDADSDVNFLQQTAAQTDLSAVFNTSSTKTTPFDTSPFEIKPYETEDGLAADAHNDDRVEIKELVFVDTGIDNYESLLSGLLEGRNTDNIKVIYIDADENGVELVTQTLLGFTGVQSVHLLTHGKAGEIQLGNSFINNHSLANYANAITQWQQALGEDADILIYGCDIAATDAGRELLKQLAELTQADIAASDDLTGHASLGGDWDLEFNAGEIETEIIVTKAAQQQWQGLLVDVNYINTGGGDFTETVSSSVNVGQDFSYNSGSGTYTVNEISLNLARYATAESQTVTVQLLDAWNGTVLGSDSVASSEISSDGFEWHSFGFADVSLTDGATYFVRVSSDADDSEILIRRYNSSVIGGHAFQSNGTPNGDGNDLAFKISYEDGSNSAPYVDNAVPDQAATEDVFFSYMLPANTFADPDSNDTIRIRVELSGGGSLGWLQYNEDSQTFSGTPRTADVGTMSIDVIATDNHGASITDTFDIVINGAPTAVDDSTSVWYTETVTGNVIDGTGGLSADTVADAPGTIVSITYDSVLYNSFDGSNNINIAANEGTFVINQDGTFTYTPTATPVSAGANTTTDWETAYNLYGYTSNQSYLDGSSNLDLSTADETVLQSSTGLGIAAGLQDHIENIGPNPEAVVVDLQANYREFEAITSYLGSGETGTWEAYDSSFVLVDTGTLVGTGSGNSTDLSTNYEVVSGDFRYLVFTATTGTDSYRVYELSGFQATPTDETFDYVVEDSNGDQDTGLLTVAFVNDNNRPTVANAIPDQVAPDNEPFSFTFAADTFNDADGETLTYSAELKNGGALPSWLSFDANTRTFSGTPATSDVGTIEVRVTADDGNWGTPAQDIFEIAVNDTNDDPTLDNALVDQSADQDAAFSYQFAANTFGDLDAGDTLTYTAELSGGGALPAWLTFTPGTRTFSGTPASGDVGTITIEVTADDSNGGTPATDTFDIVVSPPNQAPVNTVIADFSSNEDVPIVFNQGNGVIGSYFNNTTLTGPAVDTNVDYTIDYYWTGAPDNGVTGVNADNFSVRWEGQLLVTETGNHQFQTMSDDGIRVYIDGDLVIDNWASHPSGTIDTSSNIALVAGRTYDVVVEFYENNVEAEAKLFWQTPSSGGFNIISSGDEDNFTAGLYQGNEFSVFDTDAGNDELEVTISVDSGTLDLVGIDGLTFTTGDGTADSTMVFTGTADDINSALAFLTFTPTANFSGNVSLTFTTNDQGNNGFGGPLSDTDVVTITVNSTDNDDPQLDNALVDQNATEDSPFSYQFAANSFSDPDVGDTITYSAQISGGGALPSWLTFTAGTRTFSGTPTNDDVGTISIEVTADDGNGGTAATDVFDITVANTNDPPTVANQIPNQAGAEDSAFDYTFPANTFNDIDGDSLTYTARLSTGDPLPPWLNFDGANRRFYGTPGEADSITWTVEVTADDGNGETVTDTFDIAIANTNDDPYLANAIPDLNTGDNEAFSYQFAANTFGDSDLDTLTYTAELFTGGALPAWLNFDGSTRTFSGTPSTSDIGTTHVRLIADDGNGGTPAEDSFNITVTDTNDDPYIANAVADQAATEDSPFSFQFAANTFGDYDGDTLTYTAQLSGGALWPGWLTFTPGTRTFSGTPDNGDVGTITIELTADDGNGGTPATETFDIVIANTDDDPYVDNAIPDQAATEDTPFSFQFSSIAFADDDPGDSLTYTAQLSGGGSLPTWLTFTPATRTFSGTPANGDVGTISVEVIATDNDGGTTASDVFDIVVANTDDDPTLDNALVDQAATEDTAFSYQFAANSFSDPDVGDTLTYTAQLSGGGSLPAWLTFTPATRTFSGTPANGDVGTISVEVIATDDDGGTTASDVFDITVSNTDDDPTLDNALVDQAATEDTAFSYQFAANSFSDPDVGDTLTYTAQLSGGGSLPAWLTFTPATRTFSGTPANGDVGTISVEVIATDNDGGTTASDVFDITVSNTDDDPTLDNALVDQAATEDTAFSYQFAANSFSDPDAGDTLTYTAQLSGGGSLPAWLTFTPATRTFSGTPANGDVGTISVEVIATDDDGGTTASDVFDITVSNTDDDPTLDDALVDQAATEDTAFSYQFAANSFSDPDVGDTLTYTAQLSGGGSLPTWLTFTPATRTFSGTPANGDVGTISVEVIATDNDGGTTASDVFDITVSNTDDDPTLDNALVDQAATEDAAFSYQFAANSFSDPDAGDTLTYTAQLSGGGSLPAWLTFTPATRTFSGTPANGDVGTISVEVIATDDDGGTTASDVFDITVSNTDDDPTLDNALVDQAATEDTAFSYQFAANSFSDPDVGDTLTYTAQLSGGGSLPAWLTFTPATRTFSGTPANGDVGTISVEVIATDNDGGTTASDIFDITVSNTDDDPTLDNALVDQAATEDTAFSYQFAANSFSDPDVGDTLTYTAQLSGGGSLPAWLTFTPATRTFSGTPTNGDVGTISVEVIATDDDGGTTASDVFDITVSNTDDDPTLDNALVDQAATEDTAFSYQFAANSFSDPDVGDTLTYTAQLSGGGSLPAWLTFTPATRTFSGTPANGDVGTISVEVIATDNDGGTTASDVFDIVVANADDDPTLDNALVDQAATEDTAFSYQFAANSFSDPDVGDTLTYTAQISGGGSLPTWLTFTPATRTFSGTPANGDVGTISVEVIATDNDGGTTASDVFDIVVANSDDDPTLDNALVDQAATEDTAFSYQFAANSFSDPDVGDTLTYTAQLSGGGALPTWLTFTPATRTFSGTPANGDVGTISVEVIATDNDGGTTASDVFDIVVANSDDDPTLDNALVDQAATEDTAFSYQFAANSFSDPDVGDTLTYTAQLSGGGSLPAWLTFTPATRTFSGTPANGDVGTISVEVIATDDDGGTTASDVFDITVANTDDDPTLDNALVDQAATEDTAFSYQFAANSFSDPDVGDTLTYTAQLSGGGALPAWLTFTPATRTFSGTPANGDVGTISVEVIATDNDGGTTASDVFDIVVANADDDPTLDNALVDQAATEDTAFSYQFAANSFSDPDVGDTLTYTAQLSGGGSLPAWLTFTPATRTFSCTPANGDVGTISVEVIATDNDGGTTASDVFDITVSNTDDDPILDNALVDQAATEDTAFSYQFAANSFSDPDVGDTLTYTAQLSDGGSLPAWLTFTPATRTFSGTPANGDVGTISVEVIATDNDGGITASDSFNINVLNVNDDPVVNIAIPDQQVVAGRDFSMQLSPNTFIDVDVGDSLVYTANLISGAPLPTWLVFDGGVQSFSGRPGTSDIGSYTVEVIANDGNGGIPARESFVLVVHSPTAVQLANIATQEDAANDEIDLATQFASITPSGESISFTVTQNSNTSLFSEVRIDNTTGTLTLAYAADQYGESDITISAVTNTGVTLESTFNVTVSSVNDIPQVTQQAITGGVIEPDSLTRTVNVMGGFFDIENGEDLVYTVTENSNPAIAQVVAVDSERGTFTINRAGAEGGTANITVRATDNDGGWVERTVRITIQEKLTSPLEPEPQPEPQPEPEPEIPEEVKETPPEGEANETPVAEAEKEPSLIQPELSPELGIVVEAVAPPLPPASVFEFYEEVERETEQNEKNNAKREYERQLREEAAQAYQLIGISAGPGGYLNAQDITDFNMAIDDARKHMEEVYAEQKQREGMLATVTLSLTTGLIIWALRASSLLVALFSMMPLWRGVDPLPVLADVEKRKKALAGIEDDKEEEDKKAGEVGYLFDRAVDKPQQKGSKGKKV